MSETSLKCNRCGAPLPPDAPEGLCPRCLVALNLATQTEVTGETAPHGPAVSKPSPAPVSEIAKLFPQLEIIECLGRGGMGAVYKARQPRLDRLVALKILSPEKQSDSKFAERFEREARTLARLHHPNIVTIYDFGEVQGNYYLLMEFVDGLTLRQLFHARKFSSAEALKIVPEICEALQYAHEQGIVHRDIKPENILLDKQGRVKIADFGIAKILGVEGGQQMLTGAKDVVGTPHYMAPEQIEKPTTVDHRADIYSLGVVFYEMLTGELPLGKFQPPSAKVQIDVRLDEVVLHALEKEPERRYQHVSQVKMAVETIATTPESSRNRHEAQTEKRDGDTKNNQRLLTSSPTKSDHFWRFIVIVLVVIPTLGFLGNLAIKNFIKARSPAVSTTTASSASAAAKSTAGYGETVAGLPPVVVETWPVSGARDVEPGVAEIRVRFSKEMTDGSWSWSTAWKNSTPETIGQIHYENDQRTCVLNAKLEPGRTYAYWLNSEKFQNFTDRDGRAAVPYLLFFQTKQKPTSSSKNSSENSSANRPHVISVSPADRATNVDTNESKSESETAVVSTAQSWLALIDDGRYSESWKEASAIVQGAVTEAAWENSMNTFRKPLGNLVLRKLKSAQHMTELPGATDGQYVVMQFETSFTNKKSAIETVTFMLEKDGQWKSAGYFIK